MFTPQRVDKSICPNEMNTLYMTEFIAKVPYKNIGKSIAENMAVYKV